jgi:hypothetical protein
MTYLIQDITFYKVDDEGNEELNKDGTTKVYRIKQGTRVKALEYLTEEFEDDIMEQERTNNETR